MKVSLSSAWRRVGTTALVVGLAGVAGPWRGVAVASPTQAAGRGAAALAHAETAVGAWSFTGSMHDALFLHTATRLLDGTVLVTGGCCRLNTVNATAEVYDPTTGTWRFTGTMHRERERHTATLLANGQVLVAGGQNLSGNGFEPTAELYNPATGTWTLTGSMHTGRYFHTATLLTDGRVLIAGGNNGWALASAELYDPRTGTWTVTGSMSVSREFHTMTLLGNGRVLVAAGYSLVGTDPTLASAELYDPTTGTWTATGAMHTARCDHTATLLPDGRVLVAGGVPENKTMLASAELYDPHSGTWSMTGSMGAGRALHTATLLADNHVLVAGGETGYCLGVCKILATAELYDPTKGTWMATGQMHVARDYHTATLLHDGAVLVAGGCDNRSNHGNCPVASAELYHP